MDTLLALPRDPRSTRNILFTLPVPFSLNTANYKLFWPLIDNVYSLRKSRDVPANMSRAYPNRPAHKHHYVICRFNRARDTLSSSSLKRSRDTPASSSQRGSTTKRAEKSCDVTFHLLEFEDHVEFHNISHYSLIHSHLLDESDANKRNSLIRGLAGKDVAKGYAPAAVIGSLRGTGDSNAQLRLASAGGAYLT